MRYPDETSETAKRLNEVICKLDESTEAYKSLLRDLCKFDGSVDHSKVLDAEKEYHAWLYVFKTSWFELLESIHNVQVQSFNLARPSQTPSSTIADM